MNKLLQPVWARLLQGLRLAPTPAAGRFRHVGLPLPLAPHLGLPPPTWACR